MKKSGVSADLVGAIGLSGQMHGAYFDRQNRVIRKALSWNDQRTANECEEITSAGCGRKRVSSKW